ncbi:hypothetical protein BJV78DRAFT_1221997 [Lactifluus subvellereus]|nr:hypothetical protein BJV78DRAFT_1221997 [Lactifluus subvellereus]
MHYICYFLQVGPSSVLPTTSIRAGSIHGGLCSRFRSRTDHVLTAPQGCTWVGGVFVHEDGHISHQFHPSPLASLTLSSIRKFQDRPESLISQFKMRVIDALGLLLSALLGNTQQFLRTHADTVHAIPGGNELRTGLDTYEGVSAQRTSLSPTETVSLTNSRGCVWRVIVL